MNEPPVEPFGTPPAEARSLRFRDAMPRPVLWLFVIGALGAIAGVAYALVSPPSQSIALQERRPPPRAPYTHDVGKIAPAPVPRVIPRVPAPCHAVSRTTITGGGDAVVRIGTALQRICALSSGGVPAGITRAIGGLDGATIRFGGFDRTGAESTADIGTRTIWLNIKLALHSTPPVNLAPVIVHEAWHLSAGATPTAATELDARAAEVAACRQLIDVRQWPRWCNDAERLTSMPRARSLALLVGAGYPS